MCVSEEKASFAEKEGFEPRRGVYVVSQRQAVAMAFGLVVVLRFLHDGIISSNFWP